MPPTVRLVREPDSPAVRAALPMCRPILDCPRPCPSTSMPSTAISTPSSGSLEKQVRGCYLPEGCGLQLAGIFCFPRCPSHQAVWPCPSRAPLAGTAVPLYCRLVPLHGPRGVPARAVQQQGGCLLLLHDRLPAVRGGQLFAASNLWAWVWVWVARVVCIGSAVGGLGGGKGWKGAT